MPRHSHDHTGIIDGYVTTLVVVNATVIFDQEKMRNFPKPIQIHLQPTM